VSTSDWIAIVSLAVAIVALGVAIFAISRANKTTSAATLVTLNEAFSQAWERFLQPQSEPDTADYSLGELLNLLEIGCAIYIEKSLTGNSRELMREYLGNVLSLLIKTPEVNDRALHLLQTQATFIFIKRFLKARPRGLSVTIPPKWYELQP
jgi:hypothetical protein